MYKVEAHIYSYMLGSEIVLVEQSAELSNSLFGPQHYCREVLAIASRLQTAMTNLASGRLPANPEKTPIFQIWHECHRKARILSCVVLIFCYLKTDLF